MNSVKANSLSAHSKGQSTPELCPDAPVTTNQPGMVQQRFLQAPGEEATLDAYEVEEVEDQDVVMAR